MNSLDDNTTIKVKPDKTRLLNLLDEIYDGSLKIPVFQRDWSWKPQQMLELFDSISKGYPVGSLLFWKPERRFDSKEYIGPYKISRESKNTSYVLDGFQRISTLFGALMNPKKFAIDEKIILKEFQIFYDLKAKEFTYLKGRRSRDLSLIPLFKIVDTFEFIDYVRDIEHNLDSNFSYELIENAKEISKVFFDYEIPFIEIRGGDIRSAVQIFSRVNSTGSEISTDFMLSALTYNEETNFLLSENITQFINELRIYNFSTIKRDTILNCISNSKGKVYFDVKIEELLKSDLEELTNRTFEHILKTIKFLYQELLVVDIRLLPYPTQLIFITEYFRLNPNPGNDDLQKLKNWFWITTYSNYFTIYSLSQQRAAYKIFISFTEGAHPDGIYRLNVSDQFEAARFPEKINFTGVRTKALQLFLINKGYTTSAFNEGENVKEIFIFNKKDRTPGNLIIRKDSDVPFRDISFFFANSTPEDLKNCFITPELVKLYTEDKEEEFIIKREDLIKAAEKRFVENFNIAYETPVSFNS